MLESTTSLSLPDWQSALDLQVINNNNGRWEVTVPLDKDSRFFRLRKP